MTRPDVLPLGSSVWSRTRFRNDDAEAEYRSPLGGHIFTDGPEANADGEPVWPVIGLHHGRPEIRVLTEAEIDWDAYEPLVNKASLRSLGKAMAQAEARGHRLDDRMEYIRYRFSQIVLGVPA